MDSKFFSRRFMPLAFTAFLILVAFMKGIFWSLSAPAWNFLGILFSGFILFAGWYCKIRRDFKVLENGGKMDLSPDVPKRP